MGASRGAFCVRGDVDCLPGGSFLEYPRKFKQLCLLFT